MIKALCMAKIGPFMTIIKTLSYLLKINKRTNKK